MMFFSISTKNSISISISSLQYLNIKNSILTSSQYSISDHSIYCNPWSKVKQESFFSFFFFDSIVGYMFSISKFGAKQSCRKFSQSRCSHVLSFASYFNTLEIFPILIHCAYNFALFNIRFD